MPLKINIKFRVLIIGRANAGKTCILQRVCDTTESPTVFRVSGGHRKEIQLESAQERGHHNIMDELIFTNHAGYVFHDSRGFECGGEEELKTVQAFIRGKNQERRLNDRLHAIWYCIPTDNQRPMLDLTHFKDICPDKTVPVIAIFTKYEQFRDNIEMDLEDGKISDTVGDIDAIVEEHFQTRYLEPLLETPRFVRLERMHEPGTLCTDLIEKTADALNDETLALMLFALRSDNLEINISAALKRAIAVLEMNGASDQDVIRKCLVAFPHFFLTPPTFPILTFFLTIPLTLTLFL